MVASKIRQRSQNPYLIGVIFDNLAKYLSPNLALNFFSLYTRPITLTYNLLYMTPFRSLLIDAFLHSLTAALILFFSSFEIDTLEKFTTRLLTFMLSLDETIRRLPFSLCGLYLSLLGLYPLLTNIP